MKTFFAAIAGHRPFRPTDRQGEQEQRTDVGNHERSPSVGGSLAGEAQEISEPDSRSRHGQDHSHPRAPLHFFLVGIVHTRDDRERSVYFVSSVLEGEQIVLRHQADS
jgi:hypothetical protein